jgi:pyruvate/2-oxoglutarate dehydrogenase complex dihydrolipoamide dehydrogenase (E3) component
VVSAEEVLTGRVSVKRKVAIAGGGMIGCETATYLGSLSRQVTILEMLPTIAADEEFTRRFFLLKMIEDQRIRVLTGAKITGITDTGVRVEQNAQLLDIAADTVVLALGMEPDTALAKELEGMVPLKIVGDALQARNALEAIREGFLAGAQA